MVSTDSPKEKPDTSELLQVLTQSEIALLRQDMKESIRWAQAELQRRREQRNQQPA